MNEQQIFDKISNILQSRFNVSANKITKDLNFKKDLNADSIDMVELTLELEDEFGSDISDEDAQNIKTVGDAINYIKSHQNK